MPRSTTGLPELVAALANRARRRGWSDAEWARRAGLPKETLCRLRGRTSCDVSTLERLATAVDSRLTMGPRGSEPGTDGLWPRSIDRDYEDELLDVLVHGRRELTLDTLRALGPAFFVAGLVVLLASEPAFETRRLLALAEDLHPGITELPVMRRWLAETPLSPSRFMPRVDTELATEARVPAA